MEKYAGKSIFPKIAIGKIFFYEKKEYEVNRVTIEDAEAEVKRFWEAKATAIAQIKELYSKAFNEVGADNAAIIDIHMMMMEDADYTGSIEGIIREKMANAEYAVSCTSDLFSDMFAQMDDEYMKARAADIKDISKRLISILSSEKQDSQILSEQVIVVAEDLAPSETVQMDKSRLLGFVTKQGSSNSHTAILAKTMNIPALIGLEIQIQKSWDGKLAVIDGYTGTLTIEPDKEYLEKMQAKMDDDIKKVQLLKSLKGKESITLDGRRINIYANIGSIGDTVSALEHDAEGIGLFRSEFLYLEKDNYPTETEQFIAYKTVAENMAGKKVIIRTLDIGADKQADYFQLEKEENPAMGYRAIRICLDRVDIFKTQLRALLRASVYGNISIMFPMIISKKEVYKIKEILEEVKQELMEAKIPYKDVEIGIMIETPAAVLISDELAQEVDFFSIGTNDLTQYTLAIDRQNAKLDSCYDAHHPAVLKSIQMVVDNGHKAGIWVGICGELGADLTLTETFLRMQVDELSVSPPFVLKVREKVRSCSCSIA